MVPEVRIASVLKPYKADVIFGMTLRYQVTGASITSPKPIIRAFLLDTIIANKSSGTTNVRILAAVRVNSVTLTTSTNAGILWSSQYAPSQLTTVNGTSTTAAGIYRSRPPANSTASFWSLTGSNETEVLFSLLATSNDYIDVSMSCVFMDSESPINVTTVNAGVVNSVYRTYLDGPAGGAQMVPVGPLFIN